MMLMHVFELQIKTKFEGCDPRHRRGQGLNAGAVLYQLSQYLVKWELVIMWVWSYIYDVDT